MTTDGAAIADGVGAATEPGDEVAEQAVNEPAVAMSARVAIVLMRFMAGLNTRF